MDVLAMKVSAIEPSVGTYGIPRCECTSVRHHCTGRTHVGNGTWKAGATQARNMSELHASRSGKSSPPSDRYLPHDGRWQRVALSGLRRYLRQTVSIGIATIECVRRDMQHRCQPRDGSSTASYCSFPETRAACRSCTPRNEDPSQTWPYPPYPPY